MTFQLKIEGMMCGHCTAHVQKALQSVAGVTEVTVSLEEKCAIVKADAAVSVQQLKAAVEQQDYTVTEVKSI